MTGWIAASLAGAVLGMLLFGCVRLRNHFGTSARAHFGEWGYRVTWVGMLLVMVGLAELTLFGLRSILGAAGTGVSWVEVWFGVLALGIGGTLALRHGRRCAQCNSAAGSVSPGTPPS